MKILKLQYKIVLPLTKKLICFVQLLFLPIIIFSQNINLKFHHINKNQISGEIYLIFQDSQDFLWCSQNQGLVRYDGYYTTPFYYSKTDSLGLSDSRINSIVEDNRNQLWISTDFGLNCLDLTTLKFSQSWKKSPQAKLLSTLEIKASCLDKKNNILWLGGNWGILKFNIETYQITYKKDIVNDTSFFENNSVRSIIMGQNNDNYLATYNGLYHIKNKTVTNLFRLRIDQVTIDSKNKLWLVSRKEGVWVSNQLKNPQFSKINEIFHQHPAQPFVFNEDMNGNYWVCVRDVGIYLLEKNSTKWELIKHNIYDPNSIQTNVPLSFFEDRTGNIWIGTFESGLEMLDSKQKRFTNIIQGFQPSDLQNSYIRALYCDSEDNVWVGTRNNGMLSKFDRKNHTFIHYKYNKNDKYSISDSSIFSITEYSPDYLWVGTQTGGLNLFHKKTGKCKHFVNEVNNKNSLSTNSISSICNSNDGKLWIGSYISTINVYDYKTKKISNFLSENIGPVRNIYKTKDGKLWFIANIGFYLHIKDSTFIAFKNERGNKKALSNNNILSIFEDSKQRLWIGTGFGLNLMDRKTNTFTTYYESDGLSSNTINGILEDKLGNLWISTSYGITKFNVEQNKFTNYTVDDGLFANDFSGFMCCKTSDDQMYFAGRFGFTMFYPDQIIDNTQIPKVYLSDFKIFNSSVPVTENGILKKHISSVKKIILSHKETVFSIDYVAINYSSTNKNKYAYFMEGVDKDWNYVGNQMSATYTNLNSGIYTFRVKACNNDGYWNNTGASIQIEILPPWWKTKIFIFTVIIFVILSIVLLFNLRIRYIKKQQNELMLLVKQRTAEQEQTNQKILEQHTRIEEQTETLQFQTKELVETNEQLRLLNGTKDRLFSIIGHDLRNPFHLILGFSELLMNDYKSMPQTKIQKYLNIILVTLKNSNILLDNLLQWSKTQIGNIKIEKTEINLLNLVIDIKNFFNVDSEKKEIDIFIHIDASLVFNADKNMIQTIIRNLTSNALKFTPINGKITISAIQNSLSTQISISDTGVGISEETLNLLFKVDHIITTKGTSNESGTGLGLMICKEFVEKNGGKIWVESILNKGTTFTFTVANK